MALPLIKALILVRRLRETGATVIVVMTDAAKEFITPLTMQAVSGNPVHDNLLDTKAEAAMGHIELARWADLIIIAPASADFIAQLSHGLAADLLTTLCLAAKSPIAIAPAMNQQMWHAKATQANLTVLKNREVTIFAPTEGSQACGDVGIGRMQEPLELVKLAENMFATGSLQGRKVVITAGPTQEAIDPVRFISNHSSGKMGYALAEAALEAGASVTLISGPTALATIPRVTCINVITANEMLDGVQANTTDCDIFIAAAAVCDYRSKTIQPEKIKTVSDKLTLTLVLNPDILAEVAAREMKPFCVGFAAETQNVLVNAEKKLRDKKLDLVIANQVGQLEGGFLSDENACSAIWAGGQQDFPLSSKRQLARNLIALIAKHYNERHPNKNS